MLDRLRACIVASYYGRVMHSSGNLVSQSSHIVGSFSWLSVLLTLLALAIVSLWFSC